MLGITATLTQAIFAYLCICVFVFVYLQVRHPGTLFLRSLYHHLSENIWFVWSKTSYSGDKRRCHGCGTNERQTNDRHLKIELLSQWKLEAEFCKKKILNTDKIIKTKILMPKKEGALEVGLRGVKHIL